HEGEQQGRPQARTKPFRTQGSNIIVQADELCGHSAHIRCKSAQPTRLDRRIEEKYREYGEGRRKVQHAAQGVAPCSAPANGQTVPRIPDADAFEVPGSHPFATLYFVKSLFASSAAFSSTSAGSPPSYTASQASGRYSAGLTPERTPRVSGELPASLAIEYAVSIAGISSSARARVSSSHAELVTGK